MRNRGESSWQKVWLPWGLSLLLNMSVLFLLFYKGSTKKKDSDLPPIENIATIDTRLVSEEDFERLGRQVVKTEVPKNLLPEDKGSATYLAEIQQRVVKETQVEKFGSPEGVKPMLDIHKFQPLWNEMSSNESQKPVTGSLERENSKRPLTDIEYGNLYDIADSVAFGPQTILNTDKYIYSSFYTRLQENVGPLYHSKLHQLKLKPGTFSAGDVFLTVTQVWLDEAGVVKRVRVASSSGVSLFDKAAVDALSEMSRAQNPPKSLKNSEGLYEVKLGFEVTIVANSFQFHFIRPPVANDYQYMR